MGELEHITNETLCINTIHGFPKIILDKMLKVCYTGRVETFYK